MGKKKGKANAKTKAQDRRILIGGAFLLLLALVIFLTLPALVDVNVIQAEMKAAVKQATGLDIEIQDAIEVSILPYPHAKMKNIYISNVPGASTSFLLSAKSLDLKFYPTSLLTAHPVVDSVVVDGVVIELERLKNGHLNWQEMARYTANSATYSAVNEDIAPETRSDFGNIAAIVGSLSKISGFTVSGAEVHFTDAQLGIVSDYSDINLKFANNPRANQSSLNATMSYGELPMQLTAQMEEIGQAFTRKTSSVKIKLESDQNAFDYEGTIGFTENLVLKGKTAFESRNMARWIKLLNNAGQGPDKIKEALKPIPLKMTSDVITEGKKIIFPSITVRGGVLSGVLQATLKMPLTWDIKGTLDTVNLDTIVSSGIFKAADILKKQKENKDDSTSATLASVGKKSLWSYLTFVVDLKATNVDYNHSHIQNGHIEFDMSDGELAISQASGKFPGDSRLIFTGIGKESYDGFMIDGQLDGSGENFIDMASVFKDNSAAILLPVDFKRFRFKTNMVLSAKELRFTELTSRIENMAFVGDLIATFGERNKIQAAMRIAGIDLDHFYILWGGDKLQEKLKTESVNTAKTDDDITLWLRGIDYDLDMRASLEKYTLEGQQREKCKFRVDATKNKIKITELEMGYNDTQIAGRGVLDVTENKPSLDVDVTADTLDLTSYMGQQNWLFDADQKANNAPKNSHNWSHKGFNFQWFDTINGTYSFRLGQLKNGNFEATSIDVNGSLSDRIFSVASFGATMNGAQVSGKGFIKGEKIPSANIAGDVNNFDVSNLTSVLPVLQGMSGKYNTHFHVTTSGIDIFTWIYNMDGNIGIAARDVTVDGFNLPGIVGAVGQVRTVADILVAVRRAFPGGSTVFSGIEGEWSLGSGVLRTPALKLKNNISEGLFSGEVDIINWKMVGHIALALFSLDQVNPPKMSITFTGSLDNIEKELDTSLLEQYVANRTSEKLLHQAQ